MPKRIVSLDYCTDQFVLKLADRDQIAALSPDADRKFSYMRDAARGAPKVRAAAEEVMALKPDLVVRYYGGGSAMGDLLQRAGIPVVQLGVAEGLDGVRHNVRQMANAFGHPKRGEALIAQMDQRIAAAGLHPTGLFALYMSQGGVIAGAGTPVDEMLHAAGLKNFTQTPGWTPIPLEALAYHQPDIVAGAFFGSAGKPAAIWSAARHPVAQRQLTERPSVMLDGAATACGGWFIADAIEALSATARSAKVAKANP
ncbi:MAG: ABC transporter substrate-binding protein [Caulobacterales bacterium]